MTITREQVERATDAAYDCNAQGVSAALGAEWYWEPEDIRICEIPANPPHRASGRATYAAALSAAEAERAAKPDHLAYADSPVWDDGPMPKPERAPEVVDVPQPIVKRCACPDVHDAVEATWQSGEPYLTVTHTTIPLALLRAMLEAIDAQQGGA